MAHLDSNPGQRSFEVQFTVDSRPDLPLDMPLDDPRYVRGRYTSTSEEFRTQDEALAFAKDALSREAAAPSQVSIIDWQHTANLPHCLPAVRAQSLSLTTYRLVDEELVSNDVDIFGRSY